MQRAGWPAIDVEAELGDIRQWTTGRVLARRAALNPSALFLRYAPDGRSCTFADLHSRTNGIARALMQAGIEKGDHIAIVAPNCPEWLLGNFALGKIGAVAVPINTTAKATLLEYYLSHADCVAAVVAQACLEDFAPVAKRLPKLRQVFVIGGQERARELLASPTLTVAAFPADATSDEPVDGGVRSGDLAYLLFTSGTTGPSKAIMVPRCSRATRWK